jgi:hypothetical protein
MVYPMWNSLPIKVLIRPRVQRWSPANPCASGPFLSSASSLVHCCGLSFSRDTGPLDLSAWVPPSRQDLCQRRTGPLGDPQIVGDLADRVATGEPPGCIQPQPLAPPLLGGRVPAPLRIPHASVIRQPRPGVTT